MTNLKTQLKVYRGTFAEIQSLETENMSLYFAYDTREFFLGNSKGTKVPYGAGEGISENQAKLLIKEILNEQFSDLENLMEENSDNIKDTNSQLINLNRTILDHGELLEELKNDIENKLLDNTGEIVKEVNEYLKTDQFKEQINPLILDILERSFYTKNEIDILVEKFKEQILLDNEDLVNDIKSFDKYKTVEYIEGNYTDFGLSNILTKKPVGLYFINERLTYKAKTYSYRIDYDGKLYKMKDGESIWKSVYSKEEINIDQYKIKAENIVENETRRFNILLPDDNGAVNVYDDVLIGQDSTRLGKGSIASKSNSMALGADAVCNGENSIQLGKGTNTDSDTLKFNDTVIVKEGKLNGDLLPIFMKKTQVEISVSEWNLDYSATKEVELNLNDSVVCSPSSDSYDDITDCGIICESQDINRLIFKCKSLPSRPVVFNILILKGV